MLRFICLKSANQHTSEYRQVDTVQNTITIQIAKSSIVDRSGLDKPFLKHYQICSGQFSICIYIACNTYCDNCFIRGNGPQFIECITINSFSVPKLRNSVHRQCATVAFIFQQFFIIYLIPLYIGKRPAKFICIQSFISKRRSAARRNNHIFKLR